MTKAIDGEVIEPYATPELLAPGSVRRPAWISEATWARMPWPAQWRVARAEPARLAHVARVRDLEAPTMQRRPEPTLIITHPLDEITEHRSAIDDRRPCGTKAAYNRHIARGEKPCDDCRRAARLLRQISRRRSTELSTGCVDEIPCAAQAMERTG